jgi:hypothetical protein
MRSWSSGSRRKSAASASAASAASAVMLTLEGYEAGGGQTKYKVVKRPAPFGTTQSFFRKPFRGGDEARVRGWKIENAIARALYERPQRNVIRVLGVTSSYIDYQLVEDQKHPSADDLEAAEQVRNGLRNLHSLGFVYVDLHAGNVVWDPVNAEWVIIDFDLCGRMDKTRRRWTFKPDSWRQMRIATYACNNDDYLDCEDDAVGDARDECERLEKDVIARLRRARLVKQYCKEADLTRIDKIVFYIMFGRDFDTLRKTNSLMSSSPSPLPSRSRKRRRLSPSPSTTSTSTFSSRRPRRASTRYSTTFF